MKFDQIMIKEMIDSTAVGQYAAAVKLSELWYFIPVAITGSVFPAVVAAKKINNHLYLQRLNRLLRIYVLDCIYTCSCYIFYKRVDYFSTFLGDAFSPASSVLIIHIWTGVFVFVGVASTQWFVSENLQLYLLLNTSVGAVLNIAFNLYLIPIYGIQGAAIASLISYFISAYIMLLIWEKTRPNFFAISKSLNIYRVLHHEI